MKTIVFTSAATKQFDALPSAVQTADWAALDRYAIEGRGDIIKLQGREGYRLRIGEYRVLFKEDLTTILAIYVGRRGTTTYSSEVHMAQMIRTPAGEELVLLSRAEYDRLTAFAAEAEENAADVAAYDAAMAELAEGRESIMPVEISASMLRGASLLTAIRKWRGVRQTDLAKRAGISQGYLSDLESRRRKGAKATLEAIGKALDVPGHWLV